MSSENIYSANDELLAENSKEDVKLLGDLNVVELTPDIHLQVAPTQEPDGRTVSPEEPMKNAEVGSIENDGEAICLGEASNAEVDLNPALEDQAVTYRHKDYYYYSQFESLNPENSEDTHAARLERKLNFELRVRNIMFKEFTHVRLLIMRRRCHRRKFHKFEYVSLSEAFCVDCGTIKDGIKST